MEASRLEPVIPWPTRASHPRIASASTSLAMPTKWRPCASTSCCGHGARVTIMSRAHTRRTQTGASRALAASGEMEGRFLGPSPSPTTSPSTSPSTSLLSSSSSSSSHTSPMLPLSLDARAALSSSSDLPYIADAGLHREKQRRYHVRRRANVPADTPYGPGAPATRRRTNWENMSWARFDNQLAAALKLDTTECTRGLVHRFDRACMGTVW